MSTWLLLITIVSISVALACAAAARRLVLENRARSAARVAALQHVLNGDGDRPVNEGRPLFVARERREVSRAPLFAAGAAAAMIAALAAVVAYQTATPPPAPPPLELVSMQHVRDGHALTIIGTVRNPATGVAVSRVSAEVVAYDRNGTSVTSNRAPIDFLSLAPGDESAFAVTLQDGSSISRYRVAFRTGDGVVLHVDRRSDAVNVADTERPRS